MLHKTPKSNYKDKVVNKDKVDPIPRGIKMDPLYLPVVNPGEVIESHVSFKKLQQRYYGKDFYLIQGFCFPTLIKVKPTHGINPCIPVCDPTSASPITPGLTVCHVEELVSGNLA